MRVELYIDDSGESPFESWYSKLDNSLKIRVDARLARIKELDNLGDLKSLKDGVFELRFLMHSGLRIYFGREKDTLILLLTGGNKGSQNKDIEKAKIYWKKYKGADHGKKN